MKPELYQTYILSLEGSSNVFGFDCDEKLLDEIFEGRTSGSISEFIVSQVFNLKGCINSDSTYDLVGETLGKTEVKSFFQKGTKIQVGKSCWFDKKSRVQKPNFIEKELIPYVRNFNTLCLVKKFKNVKTNYWNLQVIFITSEDYYNLVCFEYILKGYVYVRHKDVFNLSNNRPIYLTVNPQESMTEDLDARVEKGSIVLPKICKIFGYNNLDLLHCMSVGHPSGFVVESIFRRTFNLDKVKNSDAKGSGVGKVEIKTYVCTERGLSRKNIDVGPSNVKDKSDLTPEEIKKAYDEYLEKFDKLVIIRKTLEETSFTLTFHSMDKEVLKNYIYSNYDFSKKPVFKAKEIIKLSNAKETQENR